MVTRHCEMWDGITLSQVVHKNTLHVPDKPYSSYEELRDGPPVIVSYDFESGMTQVKFKEDLETLGEADVVDTVDVSGNIELAGEVKVAHDQIAKGDSTAYFQRRS